MQAHYDTEADVLTLLLRSAPAHESDEGNPSVIRVEDPRRIEYLADTASR